MISSEKCLKCEYYRTVNVGIFVVKLVPYCAKSYCKYLVNRRVRK